MRRAEDDHVNAGAVLRHGAGVHHDWGCRGAQFDDVGHFGAGHSGHGIVRHDDVVDFGIEQGQGFLAAANRIDCVTETGKEPFGREAAIINIIDEEDGFDWWMRPFFHQVDRLLSGNTKGRRQIIYATLGHARAAKGHVSRNSRSRFILRRTPNLNFVDFGVSVPY